MGSQDRPNAVGRTQRNEPARQLRKLAALLDHLWTTGDVYQLLYGKTPAAARA
jgi:hypothetical protein